MTDLCYNCGDCHLPRPCVHELKHCNICGNWGHAYNFCPLSVRTQDPSYQFWALCHNCDSWHLPDPCKAALGTCLQCGNLGHKEYFCPVSAVSRQRSAELRLVQVDGKVGYKSEQPDDSKGQPAVHVHPAVEGVSAEHVRLIKTDTVREVFSWIAEGHNSHSILQMITRTPMHVFHGNHMASARLKNIGGLASEGNGGHNGEHSRQFSPAVFTPTPISQTLPTPSTNVSQMQHQRVASEGPMQMYHADPLYSSYGSNCPTGYYPAAVNSHPPVAADPATPAPAKKAKRNPSGTCSACKRSKKACTHTGLAQATEDQKAQTVNGDGYGNGTVLAGHDPAMNNYHPSIPYPPVAPKGIVPPPGSPTEVGIYQGYAVENTQSSINQMTNLAKGSLNFMLAGDGMGQMPNHLDSGKAKQYVYSPNSGFTADNAQGVIGHQSNLSSNSSPYYGTAGLISYDSPALNNGIPLDKIQEPQPHNPQFAINGVPAAPQLNVDDAAVTSTTEQASEPVAETSASNTSEPVSGDVDGLNGEVGEVQEIEAKPKKRVGRPPKRSK